MKDKWIQRHTRSNSNEWSICSTILETWFVSDLVVLIFSYYVKSRFCGHVNERSGQFWSSIPRKYYYLPCDFSAKWRSSLSLSIHFVSNFPQLVHLDCTENWKKRYIVNFGEAISILQYSTAEEVGFVVGRWNKRDSLCIVNLNKNQLSLLSLESPTPQTWIQWQSPHRLDWKNASILNTLIFTEDKESIFKSLVILDILTGNLLFSFTLHSHDFAVFGPSSEFIVVRELTRDVLTVHSWKRNPFQSFAQFQMRSNPGFYTSCEFGILILKQNHVTLRDFRNGEILSEWMLPAQVDAEKSQLVIGRTKIMLFDFPSEIVLVLE